MTIDLELLNKIKEDNLSVEEAFIIYIKHFKKEWLSEYSYSKLTYLILQKKGITDSDSTLTEKGIRIAEKLFGNPNIDNVIKEFELFWTAYPSDDSWGGYFPTRRIKNSKTRARVSYIAARKEYSAEEILEALHNHVTMMKNTSVGQNNLKYMQNPATWLSNRTFESFLKGNLSRKVEVTEYGKDVI